MHGPGELDALAVREAEHLVVVEHRVHVLDPQRVDRAVKDHPLAVGRRVTDGGAHERRDEPVRPLLRHEVELAIQLAHGDGLGVERVALHDLVEAVAVDDAVLLELRERLGENHRVDRLA